MRAPRSETIRQGDELQADANGPVVSVRGIGSAPIVPDGVRIGLTVRHRAGRPDEALADAARDAQAIEALLAELEIPPDRWVTEGISLEEWNEWEEGTRREIRRGYIASSRLVVRLPDPEAVGRLVGGVAARASASVDGPHWSIEPTNPAHEVARRRAVEDARRRAEVYADAAGLALGPVTEIVEAGAGRNLARGPISFAASAEGEMSVHAGGLEVSASVQVTYLLIDAEPGAQPSG